MYITTKDMNDAVLNFFGYLKQIHVFPTAGGALHLQLITVVLMEPLKALDEQEVDC